MVGPSEWLSFSTVLTTAVPGCSQGAKKAHLQLFFIGESSPGTAQANPNTLCNESPQEPTRGSVIPWATKMTLTPAATHFARI